MPLTLTVKIDSPIPIEVDGILPETVRGLSADDVARLRIAYGNRQPELGECFDVHGSVDEDATIVWEGDCSRVKRIGEKLTSGCVRVEGSAGMHLGAGMRGGEILCTGDAGDWAGAEMHGGRLTILGNAGDLAGGAYRGSRKGMTGGELWIHGRAGNEVGRVMRRGLIAVGGDVGDAAGAGMIAGSLLVFGSVGKWCGTGMKRGTVGLLSLMGSPELLPSFEFSCHYRPTFLSLYLRHLKSGGFPVPEESLSSVYRRYCGDLLELGKGELLVCEAA